MAASPATETSAMPRKAVSDEKAAIKVKNHADKKKAPGDKRLGLLLDRLGTGQS